MVACASELPSASYNLVLAVMSANRTTRLWVDVVMRQMTIRILSKYKARRRAELSTRWMGSIHVDLVRGAA